MGSRSLNKRRQCRSASREPEPQVLQTAGRFGFQQGNLPSHTLWVVDPMCTPPAAAHRETVSSFLLGQARFCH